MKFIREQDPEPPRVTATSRRRKSYTRNIASTECISNRLRRRERIERITSPAFPTVYFLSHDCGIRAPSLQLSRRRIEIGPIDMDVP